MPELKQFLKDLISLPGLSGFEAPVRERVRSRWEPLVDELSVSPIGSLHALKRGTAAEPRSRIMLAAHMDAIGLMVTQVSAEGLIYFRQVGGVDPRILPSTPVRVFAREELPGIIGYPPDRFLPPSARGKPVQLDYLFVDVGLEAQKVKELVRPGDLISFDTQPMELPEDLLAGHTLDDRAAVAAVTACLEELQTSRHAWDVYAVATAQEEVTLGGAFTSPFTIRPDIAIAIDVTFAKGPGNTDYRSRNMGKAVALGLGPNSHPWVYARLKKVCEDLEIPFEVDAYTSYSGTDAMGMQLVAEGIPTMVVSIPLRYMHTPVEMISMKDIRRTGRLLAQFITHLAADAAAGMKWDEEEEE